MGELICDSLDVDSLNGGNHEEPLVDGAASQVDRFIRLLNNRHAMSHRQRHQRSNGCV